MAFRASNVIPVAQYDRAKQLAVQLKRLAENRSASFTTGASASQVLALVDNLNALKAGLNDAKSVPGIAQYADVQENDAAYDVAAEFNAVIAAVDTVVAEVVATLPKDAGGWLLINKINGDGSLTPRDFTGPQLANIKTLLDAIAAAII